MRFDIVRAVFRKELREMLRDRRSLAVMFGIPLLLYPLVAIGMATLGSAKKKELTEQTVKVYIPGGKQAVPRLVGLMNDQYTGLTAVELFANVDPNAALKSGELQAILHAPPNAEAKMLAGEEVELKVQLDRSRTSTPFSERKLNGMLDDYKKWVVEQRLMMRGVSPVVLQSFKTSTHDVSSGHQRFGKILAQMLPLLLLMTGMLGALFPALNATTTERELGTLETLLVTPAGRTELLVAKGSLVLVCGLLTAGLNMVSMALVLKRATSMLDASAAEFSVSATSLALTYLAAVPTLILFTTVVLIMGLLARNFREANAFATPVMLLPLASLAVGIMEPAASPAILITPIANTTVIIREVLTGRISAGPFLLAFAASGAYAGLVLSAAARLFSNEQLVNPAWEPLSVKGLRRTAGAQARGWWRIPSVDEALLLFFASLLLLFYVSPEWHKRGLLYNVLGNEALLILLPALLFAWVARWEWRETFALKPASASALLGAALLGIGLAPWVQMVAQLQKLVWPGDSETTRAVTKLITDALNQNALLTIVGIGVMAGVCEELFYRGPLQTAFVKKMRPWAAIVLVGILFGAIHMDLRGLPLRAALGALFGWMVWRGKSIYPAMIAHGIFDSTSVALFYWAMRRIGAEHIAAAAEKPGFHVETSDGVALAVGAVLIFAGAWMFRRTLPAREKPETAGFPVTAEPAAS